MTYTLCAALGLCLALAGCAGPLDQTWDDPLYQTIHGRYADRDRQVSETPLDGTLIQSSPRIDDLDRLSIDDAIRIAITNSPALRSAGYRIDAAGGRATQVGLYPNPTFVFDAEALGSRAGRGGETTYRIEQELVLGGKLARAREVAQADRLAARAEFRAQEFALASRVSGVYFAAVAAQGRLDRRGELAELAGQLLDAVAATDAPDQRDLITLLGVGFSLCHLDGPVGHRV